MEGRGCTIATRDRLEMEDELSTLLRSEKEAGVLEHSTLNNPTLGNESRLDPCHSRDCCIASTHPAPVHARSVAPAGLVLLPTPHCSG